MTTDSDIQAPIHPFDTLTPDMIMDAVESTGRICDGRMLALNSYENRVYQVGIDEQTPLIVKFYRPERWSVEQILEEHAFAEELLEHELSVVAPEKDSEGQTLQQYDKFHFAVFPRRGGHSPEINENSIHILGCSLGKMHSIGMRCQFEHRQTLSLDVFGHNSREFLLNNDFIPGELRQAYESLTTDLLEKVAAQLASHDQLQCLRLHGDCHTGNILWRDDVPHYVDFDDCMNGPAIQDLWMLLSGDRDQQQGLLSELIEGYDMFCDFKPAQLSLIEALRTMRLMHYSAWLARRWHDPAFPRSFPWFNTVRYWSEHILELREQMSAMDEPALQLF